MSGWPLPRHAPEAEPSEGAASATGLAPLLVPLTLPRQGNREEVLSGSRNLRLRIMDRGPPNTLGASLGLMGTAGSRDRPRTASFQESLGALPNCAARGQHVTFDDYERGGEENRPNVGLSSVQRYFVGIPTFLPARGSPTMFVPIRLGRTESTMQIDKSKASKCRYGADAVKAFAGADVLWERAEDDYQGTVAIIGKSQDGRHFFYEWSYGSCSGCDDWEARDLTTEQIQAEMLSKTAFFPDVTGLLAWLDMTDTSGAYFRPKRAEVEAILTVPAPAKAP